MPRTSIFSLFVLGALAAACSGAPKGDAPDFESDSPNVTEGDPGASSGSEQADPDAAAPSTEPAAGEQADAGADAAAPAPKTYEGTLAATSKVPFGGGTDCSYTVTLKNVAVDMTVAGTGEVTAATVKDTMIEETPRCATPTIKPNDQVFDLKSATKTDAGMRLVFTGAKTNQPVTALTADVAETTTGYVASLVWKRTDAKPSLNWTVTATILLKAK